MKDLTPRERATARCLLHGWSNERIAKELGVTVSTVKSHVGKVMAAVDAPSRSYAIKAIVSRKSRLAYVMELPL